MMRCKTTGSLSFITSEVSPSLLKDSDGPLTQQNALQLLTAKPS